MQHYNINFSNLDGWTKSYISPMDRVNESDVSLLCLILKHMPKNFGKDFEVQSATVSLCVRSTFFWFYTLWP